MIITLRLFFLFLTTIFFVPPPAFALTAHRVYQFKTTSTLVVKALAFSKDGHFGFTNSEEGVRMWDLRDGSFVKLFPGPGLVNSISLSQDGTFLLAGGYSEDIYLWNIENTKVVRRFRLDDHADVHFVSFLPNNQILTSSYSEVRIWNQPDTAIVTTGSSALLDRSESGFFTSSISSDAKRIIVGTFDASQLGFFDFDSNADKFTKKVMKLKPNQKPISVKAVPHHNVLFVLTLSKLLAGTSKLIKMDFTANKMKTVPTEDAVSFGISKDGTLVAVGDGVGKVSLFDTETLSPVLQFDIKKEVSYIEFSEDGRSILTGDDRGYAELWRLSDT